jgi:hypothetical protein
MAPPRFKPTEDQRELVKRAAACGLTNEQVANVLGVSEATVKKYFALELHTSSDKANMAVAGALFKSAMGGNVTAQIFWCKTRLGWRETTTLEHTGRDGTPLLAVINFGKKPDAPK